MPGLARQPLLPTPTPAPSVQPGVGRHRDYRVSDSRADTVPSAGRLRDATHVYQYVFILAGAEVLAASLVLLLGNFFCIGRKLTGATKEGESSKPPADDRDGVDSREVEHFLKAEPEKKGEVAHTPETSV